MRSDGRRFVAAALQAGAARLPGRGRRASRPSASTTTRIAALPRPEGGQPATIASRFLGRARARSSTCVAVTGTNGKTSTTWWMAQALGALGRRCGVIGTLGIGEPPRTATTRRGRQRAVTGLTTPDPVDAAERAARLRRPRLRAPARSRPRRSASPSTAWPARGSQVALFTNFTQDHLDYHGSMAAYWRAKAQLFDWPGLQAAVVNVDDAQGAELAASCAARPLDAVDRVAAAATARLLGARHAPTTTAASPSTCSKATRARAVRSALIGDFNVANLLCVDRRACARWACRSPTRRAACAALTPVPGPHAARRAEAGGRRAGGGGRLRAHARRAGEGAAARCARWPRRAAARCGACSAAAATATPAKRPLMGAIAGRLADRVVITSDNPRDEAAGR